MKIALTSELGRIAAVVVLLVLSACAGDGSPEAPEAAAPAAQTAPTEPQLVSEGRAQREAVIESIDSTKRTITLRTQNGETKTLSLPPDADIANIRQGDVLVISDYRSLQARVLPPGSAEVGATTKPEPPKQGADGSWTQRLILVNEITAIDPTANTVTLQGADKQTRTLEVKNPEMQQRLNSLHVGDLLELTFTQTLAAGIRRSQ